MTLLDDDLDRTSIAGLEHLRRKTSKNTEVPRSRQTSVLYLRVSTEKQTLTGSDVDDQGNSIATQREATLAKAAHLKLSVAEEFVDAGASATSMSHRKAFQEMLTYVAAHPEVSTVLIYMRSRAFRNIHDAIVTKKLLQDRGVRLVSAKEDFGDGPLSDAMEAIQDVFNELQVRQNGIDISNKMLHKAQNGGTTGRAKIGYLNVRKEIEGRLINSIDLDPDRSPLIKLAFERYAMNDVSIVGLAEELEDLGLTTRPSAKRRGAPLSTSQLAIVLRDPYYCGVLRYKGELFAGRHEPLITKDLFLKVQDILDERAMRGQRDRDHHHYLKGIFFCARCGDEGRSNRLVFTEVPRRGNVYEYFFCRGRQDGSCDLPYIPARELEEATARTFGAIEISAHTAKRMSKDVAKVLEANTVLNTQMRASIKRQLDKVRAREARILDLAADGELDRTAIKERLNKITLERGALEERLAITDRDLTYAVETMEFFLDLLTTPRAIYDRADDNGRRLLLEAVFERLEVDIYDSVTVAGTNTEPIERLKKIEADYEAEAPTADEKGRSPRLSARASSSVSSETGPQSVVSSKTYLVAGTGFEPATSGL